MAAQFQVDTERIQAASGEIARISGEIDGQVAAMMTRLNALQDAWKGTAAARFHEVTAQWQGTQTQVRNSLDTIGSLLGRAGASYAETEAQTERMFI